MAQARRDRRAAQQQRARDREQRVHEAGQARAREAQRALRAIEVGDEVEAVVRADQALQLLPDEPTLLCLRGFLRGKEDPQAGLADLERAWGDRHESEPERGLSSPEAIAARYAPVLYQRVDVAASLWDVLHGLLGRGLVATGNN